MVSLIHATNQTYIVLKALIPVDTPPFLRIPLYPPILSFIKPPLLVFADLRIGVMVRRGRITGHPPVFFFLSPTSSPPHLLYQTARHMLGALAPYIERRLNRNCELHIFLFLSGIVAYTIIMNNLNGIRDYDEASKAPPWL